MGYQPTEVIITAHPEACNVHGWVPGNPYPTVFALTDFTDTQGNTVYVNSPLRQRSVNLLPGEYHLITPKPDDNATA